MSIWEDIFDSICDISVCLYDMIVIIVLMISVCVYCLYEMIVIRVLIILVCVYVIIDSLQDWFVEPQAEHD